MIKTLILIAGAGPTGRLPGPAGRSRRPAGAARRRREASRLCGPLQAAVRSRNPPRRSPVMNRSVQAGGTAHPVSGSRWRMWADWTLRILVALVFLAAGGVKLFGVPQLVQLFDKIGLGQWFRFFTAACEATGAALLLIPRAASYGAALLGCVAVGAFVTHVVVIISPEPCLSKPLGQPFPRPRRAQSRPAC